jgi:autoinducer 2-degrading protein
MSFAVCVTFAIKPEFCAKFRQLVGENAKTSLVNEKGCSRFDVCSDVDHPDEIFLYEIYTSPEAFNRHLKTEHFLSFDRETAHMISAKEARTYREVL